MNKKERLNRTGLVYIQQVYNSDHQQIGNGWMLWYEGHTYSPVISDFDGLPITEGWYNLLHTDTYLVVITKEIH